MTDSTSIKLPYNFKPRPYELDFLKALDSGKYNRFLLIWCRRAGKDMTVINAGAKYIVERVGAYYHVFPSYAQGRKALWEKTDKSGFRTLHHIPPEIRTQNASNGTNNNEMKIDLCNKSVFRILGADNIDSLVGSGPVFLALSEYALMSKSVWDFFRPMIDETQGIVVFVSTPRGKNHLYDLYQQVKHLPNWYVSTVQCLYPDLPGYYPVINDSVEDTMAAIQQAREEGTDEELIQQEYGVSFVAGAKGNYYSDQIIAARDRGRIGSFPASDHKWTDTFWDLGWNDDTVIWFCQRDGDKRTLVDYYENRNKDLAHYVQVMKERGYKYRDICLPHDAEQGKFQRGLSHAGQLKELLTQAGLDECNVIIGEKPADKQEAIYAVRSVFSQYYFNEDNKAVKEAVVKLSLYHREWNKAREVFMDKPAHDWTSHCADALSTDVLSRSQQSMPGYWTMDQAAVKVNDWNPLDD